ncbi:DUF397 domain-containing protein [Yinghuangia sp. YIM S09857]|uniref:DUF397 domain-containing protein n=1 Tax=Yinghuangia sp. YIM S09857 TaxID=3436929 RepID=UPI003F535CF7
MTEAPSPRAWRKSSYSGQQGGDCVEVAPLGGVVGTRDSKDVSRGHLVLRPEAWVALTGVLKG